MFALWSGGRSIDAAKRTIAERAAMTKPYESTGDDHVIAGGVKLYRAIDWVVDTYDQAMRENPKTGLRHGIIHANIPTEHATQVMARLQKEYDAGYPEPSATFTWWIGDTYAGNFGPTRAPRLNPFATFRSKGMIWANGSDFGVTSFAARYGIWSAIAREPL